MADDKLKKYFNGRVISKMLPEERDVRRVHIELYEVLKEFGRYPSYPASLTFVDTVEPCVKESLSASSVEQMNMIVTAVVSSSRLIKTPSEKSVSSIESSKYEKIMCLLQSDKKNMHCSSLMKLYDEMTSYNYLYDALNLLDLFEMKLSFEDSVETPVVEEAKSEDKIVKVLYSGKTGQQVSGPVRGDPFDMIAVKSEYALKSFKVDFSHDSEVLEREEVRENLTESEDARNDLESYTYNLKRQISDLSKMEKAIEEKIKWLEENQDAGTQDFKAQKKELEDIVHPIVTKLYHASIGAPPPPPTSEGDDFKEDAHTRDFEAQKKDVEDFARSIFIEICEASIGTPPSPTSEGDDIKEDADTQDFEAQKKEVEYFARSIFTEICEASIGTPPSPTSEGDDLKEDADIQDFVAQRKEEKGFARSILAEMCEESTQNFEPQVIKLAQDMVDSFFTELFPASIGAPPPPSSEGDNLKEFADTQDFEGHEEEVEDIVQPIITEIYEASIEAPPPSPTSEGDDFKVDSDTEDFDPQVIKLAQDMVDSFFTELFPASIGAPPPPSSEGDAVEEHADTRGFETQKKEAEDIVQSIVTEQYVASIGAPPLPLTSEGDNLKKDVDIQDFDAQKKEAEENVQPIITELYEASIGAPPSPTSEGDDLKEDADTQDFVAQRKEEKDFARSILSEMCEESTQNFEPQVIKLAQDMVDSFFTELFPASIGAPPSPTSEGDDLKEDANTQDLESQVIKLAEDMVQSIFTELYEASVGASLPPPISEGDSLKDEM